MATVKKAVYAKKVAKKAVTPKAPQKLRYAIGTDLGNMFEIGDFLSFEDFLKSDNIQEYLIEGEGASEGDTVFVITHPVVLNQDGVYQHEQSLAGIKIQVFNLEIGKPTLKPIKAK
jgi:hypothetical protein